jgi:hypothetical protein
VTDLKVGHYKRKSTVRNRCHKEQRKAVSSPPSKSERGSE